MAEFKNSSRRTKQAPSAFVEVTLAQARNWGGTEHPAGSTLTVPSLLAESWRRKGILSEPPKKGDDPA
jgi:hypothetical protein